MSLFQAQCQPLLIGSLPVGDHAAATNLIFKYTPAIPLWPQLPMYKTEGMLQQFLPGLPGIREVDGKTFVDTESKDFDDAVLLFYEEYLKVSEVTDALDGSRFILDPQAAPGFYTFLEQARRNRAQIAALKGQITGPFTFCTSLVDQHGRASFYNEQLKDMAIKLLAQKARWQVQKMLNICPTAIIFFDEPALAGLGSSAFITITQQDIIGCLAEVFEAVKSENALTGVHVCANTEWSVLFEAGVDILSFDAYGYFDKLVLYPQQLREFFNKGGILASGIVPTDPRFIDSETADSLVAKWLAQMQSLEALGISRDKIFAQTLITPSCGTGSLTEQQAQRVLEMTRAVSEKIRTNYM